jgi:hypothetical protein
MGYNNFCAGRGGPLEIWTGGIEGEAGWSYWGGSCVAGGGAGEDASYFTNGNLGFPLGMLWNASSPSPLPNFPAWALPPRADWGERLENLPTFSAFQNPGWFSSTFAITGVDAGSQFLNFSADGRMPYGGYQGGRNWWGSDMGQPDNLLQSGPWYVDNVFAELDVATEYYFNASTKQLFLFFNESGAPPADFNLVASQLEVFVNISGTAASPVTDVTFAGVAFRDQRTALLDPWLVPSGGDWSLRRAGLLHLEGTERVTISGCAFIRTDANAVFLAAFNRNATIIHSEFAWLGMSAVASFGFTDQNDATAGLQPWGTVMAHNKIHEIGLYEVQSSALFLGKTPLTRLEGNLLFNGPRAMVNVCVLVLFCASRVARSLTFPPLLAPPLRSRSRLRAAPQERRARRWAQLHVKSHFQHVSAEWRPRSNQFVGQTAVSDDPRARKRTPFVRHASLRRFSQRPHRKLRRRAGVR